MFFTDDSWLAIALAGLFVICLRRWKVLVLGSLLCGVLLGLWRGANERVALRSVAPYYGYNLQIQGTIAEDPTLGAHGDQRLQLRSVTISKQPVHGFVWVSLIKPAVVKRGDIVTIRGKLSEGFGTIPASMYRAQLVQITHPIPGDMARRVRDWFTGGIMRSIPTPEAMLGIGYLTGQKSALPQDFEDQLRDVGLTHAVVASGYNLTILVSLTRQVLQAVSKYIATIAAYALMGSFILVTGFSPSMTRAGIVSGLSLWAWYYGRKIHPFVLLAVAGAVTVLINPSYAWGDVGWCLSFAAFLGVMVVGPLLEHYLWGDQKPGLLMQTIVETVAAELCTLPIILVAFGHLAIYGLIANVLVVPLIPCAMACTFVAGISGLCAPSVAHVVGWPATTILHYMMSIVDRIASIPQAVVTVHYGWRQLAISYGLLALGCLYLKRKTRHRFKKS
jgi:competence protein ComEC